MATFLAVFLALLLVTLVSYLIVCGIAIWLVGAMYEDMYGKKERHKK